MSKNKQIHLATKIWFGKYKDKNKSMYEILREDITYAHWLLQVALEEYYIDPRVAKMYKSFYKAYLNKINKA